MAGTVVQLVVAVPRKAVAPHPENISFLKVIGCEHCPHCAQKQVLKKCLINTLETKSKRSKLFIFIHLFKYTTGTAEL
jgi:hypothetical protein